MSKRDEAEAVHSDNPRTSSTTRSGTITTIKMSGRVENVSREQLREVLIALGEKLIRAAEGEDEAFDIELSVKPRDEVASDGDAGERNESS